MDPEQVLLFEALASDALLEFGYEPRNTIFPNQILETARECQQWWDQNFLPKHSRDWHSAGDPQVTQARNLEPTTFSVPPMDGG